MKLPINEGPDFTPSQWLAAVIGAFASGGALQQAPSMPADRARPKNIDRVRSPAPASGQLDARGLRQLGLQPITLGTERIALLG